jgi:hypothetical protein
MAFDPNQGLFAQGRQWSFDTPMARAESESAGLNSENGRADYGLGNTTIDPGALAAALGYNLQMTQGSGSAASQEGGPPTWDQQQNASTLDSFNQWLQGHGYTLGTAWGSEGSSNPLGGSSNKYQQWFDANGNAVGPQGMSKGDNGLRLISPILMAAGGALLAPAAAGGEAAASAGTAAGSAAAYVPSSTDLAALYGPAGYDGASAAAGAGSGGSLLDTLKSGYDAASKAQKIMQVGKSLLGGQQAPSGAAGPLGGAFGGGQWSPQAIQAPGAAMNDWMTRLQAQNTARTALNNGLLGGF